MRYNLAPYMWKKYLFILFSMLFVYSSNTVAMDVYQQSKPLNEKQKIDWLIAFIAKQEGVILINKKAYNSLQAAEHIRMNWRKSKLVNLTAEEFISKYATHSIATNKPYQIKLPNGKIKNLNILLLEELKQISKQ
ncbi:MAG: DUF5329 domain-containing protein [Bacteroidia bacterium]|nr:DUF5329 domain-containing protein [Bacteroidia bacterium]